MNLISKLIHLFSNFKNKILMFLLLQNILTEGDICASQRRAACEGLGLLARLGNDIFTARMVCPQCNSLQKNLL